MKKTLEEIRQEVQKIHGDHFTVPDQEYVNNHIKMKFICNVHGEFFTRFSDINVAARGKGCPKCAKESRNNLLKKSLPEIREEVKKLHGDQFEVPEQEYINSHTKMKFICKVHGEIEARLNDIRKAPQGTGCNKCGVERRSNAAKSNLETFIKEARAVHCDKFEYFEYEKCMKKVPIKCNKDGKIFYQTPNKHVILKRGCPFCAGTMKKTWEEVKELANKEHNSKYEYPDQKYKNAKTKIRIICPIHGEFKQLPDCHYNGQGCPKCANENIYVGRYEREVFDPFIREYFKGKQIITQYPVSKPVNTKWPFLVDFVIPELNLAIEYDEFHHKYYKNETFRENYIRETTGFRIIRVNDRRFRKEGITYFKSLL